MKQVARGGAGLVHETSGPGGLPPHHVDADLQGDPGGRSGPTGIVHGAADSTAVKPG